jgi:tRNA(Phe) wybutosine-synthesizing methylase Tyw3
VSREEGLAYAVEKAEVLNAWRGALATWRAGHLSGAGAPDPDIVEWVEGVNALPGICTLQSCQGHVRGEVREAGHIWLWLSDPAYRRFESAVYDLVESDLVEEVRVLYGREKRKRVVCVVFKGNESDALPQSLDLLRRHIEAWAC